MNTDPENAFPITSPQIEEGLRALGLTEGDAVMLHASVNAIGWVVGGPDTVLQAILKVIGGAGTLMMLAGWEDSPYGLEDWPPERRRAYLDHCPPFDPHTSRADHRELGILAEYLRTWPGAARSAHPISSYVAVGRHAAHLTLPHALQYHHGPDSPLARLCTLDGKILLLGDLPQHITLLHHAEHLAKLPNKRVVRYRMPILRGGQRVWVWLEEYDTDGLYDWPEDYFGVIGRSFLAEDLGHSGRVGQAPAHLYGAAALLAYGIHWMEAHLAAVASAPPLPSRALKRT